ncbi:MAG: transposase [Azonexus sp.]|nr:transposase [Azonexus sp.]
MLVAKSVFNFSLNCSSLLALGLRKISTVLTSDNERLNKVYEVETKEDAWVEYLAWEASIPEELNKPFRPVKTAFRNWKTYILNYFDDERITNAFTESFNAKIRRVYRDGRGYTFERLRAKVLFTDRLQKRGPSRRRSRSRRSQSSRKSAWLVICA